MVHGIGIDIVEIKRISALIDKYSDAFLSKVFTPLEIELCSPMAMPAIHFSGRWAAKEAFYKALPDQLQPHSTWKSIEILNSIQSRRPVIRICDEKLKQMLDAQNISRIHISISHERSFCTAFVVLEDSA
jgi:holo-[acyl-carrier protein] synthase